MKNLKHNYLASKAKSLLSPNPLLKQLGIVNNDDQALYDRLTLTPGGIFYWVMGRTDTKIKNLMLLAL